jgi:hypothetical protein
MRDNSNALELEDESNMKNVTRSVRWKIEAAAAALFAFGAVLTALVPQWMEALGFDPDHGDGSAEWILVGLFGVAFLASAIASSVHLRVLRTQLALGLENQA